MKNKQTKQKQQQKKPTQNQNKTKLWKLLINKDIQSCEQLMACYLSLGVIKK